MKKTIGEKYKTVSICGSFSKHMKEISYAKDVFEKNGFEVLAPVSTSTVKGKNNFIYLDSDSEDASVKSLEKNYLDKMLESNIVYCCNKGGYLGKTVMFELGFMIAKGQEVIFSEAPDELLISELLESENNGEKYVLSPEALCNEMKIHNETFAMRDWGDTDHTFDPNFQFEK